MARIYNINSLRDRRRDLRKNQTPQEKLLWSKIRKDVLNYRFRRQFGIGGYILDFYCPRKKLAIELDGAIHNQHEAKKYDEVRDRFLEGVGIFVLRFSNDQIENSPEIVLRKICEVLQTKRPPS